MKILFTFLIVSLSSSICKAAPKWQQIYILDVIELLNYEHREIHQAITTEEFNLPLIIDRDLEKCLKIVAGATIDVQTVLIPDPFVEDPELHKIIAIKGCQSED